MYNNQYLNYDYTILVSPSYSGQEAAPPKLLFSRCTSSEMFAVIRMEQLSVQTGVRKLVQMDTHVQAIRAGIKELLICLCECLKVTLQRLVESVLLLDVWLNQSLEDDQYFCKRREACRGSTHCLVKRAPLAMCWQWQATSLRSVACYETRSIMKDHNTNPDEPLTDQFMCLSLFYHK